MRLAEENPGWVVGFEDETWWSRLALPSLHAWSEEGEPPRLEQRSVAKDDPDPKAVSCYGLFVPEFEQTWLRFVDGRPVSGITLHASFRGARRSSERRARRLGSWYGTTPLGT